MTNKTCSNFFALKVIPIGIFHLLFSLIVNGDEILLEPYSTSPQGPSLREEIALKFNRKSPPESIRIVVRYGVVGGDMDAFSGKYFQNIKSVAISAICENVTKKNTRFLSDLPKLEELEIGFGFDNNSTSLLPVCGSVEILILPFLSIDINSKMCKEILRLFPKLKRFGLPRGAKMDIISKKILENNGVKAFIISSAKP